MVVIVALKNEEDPLKMATLQWSELSPIIHNQKGVYRYYRVEIFISYPVSTRNSNISPRLPYQPEGDTEVEARVDTGYDMKADIS